MKQLTKEDQIRELAIKVCTKQPNFRGYGCARCPLHIKMVTQECFDRFKNQKKFGLIGKDEDIDWPNMCDTIMDDAALRHLRKHEHNFIINRLKKVLKGVQFYDYTC